MVRQPTLIILGGLPGTGKTTLARSLASELGATYVRIDTIEQALRTSRAFGGQMDDGGYVIAYAVAADNLRLGRMVIADSVNPLQITRDAWRAVATAVGAKALEVEVVCSDLAEHQRRVESRQSDIPGHRLPTWQEVSSRDYQPWDRERVVVDTANTTIEAAVAMIKEKIG